MFNGGMELKGTFNKDPIIEPLLGPLIRSLYHTSIWPWLGISFNSGLSFEMT